MYDFYYKFIMITFNHDNVKLLMTDTVSYCISKMTTLMRLYYKVNLYLI